MPTIIAVIYCILPDPVPGPIDDALLTIILEVLQFIVSKKVEHDSARRRDVMTKEQEVSTKTTVSNEKPGCNKEDYKSSRTIEKMSGFLK